MRLFVKYVGSMQGSSMNELQGYAFQCGNKSVLIAWLPETATNSYMLSRPEGVEAFNVMGVKSEKINSVWLDQSPVYFISNSLSAEQLLKNSIPIRQTPDK